MVLLSSMLLISIRCALLLFEPDVEIAQGRLDATRIGEQALDVVKASHQNELRLLLLITARRRWWRQQSVSQLAVEGEARLELVPAVGASARGERECASLGDQRGVERSNEREHELCFGAHSPVERLEEAEVERERRVDVLDVHVTHAFARFAQLGVEARQQRVGLIAAPRRQFAEQPVDQPVSSSYSSLILSIIEQPDDDDDDTDDDDAETFNVAKDL